MAVAAMLRLELYGLSRDLPGIMDLLQRAEAVEIERGDERPAGDFASASIVGIEREIADLEHLLGFFARVAPRRPNFIEQFAGVKTVLTADEFASMVRDQAALAKFQADGRTLEAELGTLAARLHEGEALLAQLRPWAGLGLAREDLDGTAHVRLVTGLIGNDDYGLLTETLAQAEPRALVRPVSSGNDGTRVAIVWPRDADLAAALANLAFNQVNLPVFSGRIEEAIASGENEIRRLAELLAEKTKAAADLASAARPAVEARLDFLRGERSKLEAARNLTASERAFALRGWIPAMCVDGLRRELAESGLPHALTVREPDPGEDVPIVLRNSRPIEPFEALIQGFSYPKYAEIDPTPVTAPFFFIFFGFCVSDIGYGLLLILFCLGLLRWLKMGPAGKKLAKMFILGGIGAILMGFVTGSFYGDLIGIPGLIDPIKKDALLLLGMALALGTIQLFLGTILSALPSLKQGRWRDAFFNQGAWLMFLISVILLLGKGPLKLGAYGRIINYLALIATALVVYSATRGKKGILGKLLGIPAGLFTIYGSIGYFSDILSYSRLMALGLSGGVMAVIINMFARMAARGRPIGILFGISIGVFGHLINVALGILGAYVHSSRLQFLEFYGKFFEGGGRPFRPLRAEHKYTFVVKQKEA